MQPGQAASSRQAAAVSQMEQGGEGERRRMQAPQGAMTRTAEVEQPAPNAPAQDGAKRPMMGAPQGRAPNAGALPGEEPTQPLPPSRPSNPAPGGAAPAMPMPRATIGAPASAQPQMEGGRERSDPSAAGAPSARQPSLTMKMRAMQPPDVARQAVSELNLLASELAALPQTLRESGLAVEGERRYRDATSAYLTLARDAWEAVAEERLEQSGAEPEYRQRAIAIARQVTQLQQESQSAGQQRDGAAQRRTPLRWRRRVTLIQTGLSDWQDALAPTPDARVMGSGLFTLRGRLGLANASGVELTLLGWLTATAQTLIGLLDLGLALLLVATALAGQTGALAGLIVTLVAGLALLALTSLASQGPAPLESLLGATLYAPSHTPTNAARSSRVVAGALRAWTALLTALVIPAQVAALAFGVLLVAAHAPFAPPSSAQQTLALAGALGVISLTPVTVVSLAALTLLAAPTLLLAALRFGGELAGNAARIPQARRYALGPALATLAGVTLAALVGIFFSVSALGWNNAAITVWSAGALSLSLTMRAVALLLALVAPYLLFIELPYRAGIERWRRVWLADLAARRADVEAHVRRLSVADPRTGKQDTSEENLRAMQYDLVLLQFYRDKIEEAERTPAAPFGLRVTGVALVIAALGALLADQLGALLLPLVR